MSARRFGLIGFMMLGVVAAFTFAEPADAAVDVRIEGVDEALAENVRLTIGQPRRTTERSIDRFIENIPDLARRAMSALGYYAAEVEVTRLRDEEAEARAAADSDDDDDDRAVPTDGSTGDPRDSAGDDVNADARDNGAEESDDAPPNAIVRVAITPNEPVRIRSVLLNINGDARTDRDYMPVLGRSELRQGAVFVSGDYEATKGVLTDRAQDLGYFEFDFTTSRVRVSRRELTADIELVADSGPRYTFGALRFEQNIFNERYLNRFVPYEPGDVYESSKLAELNTNLQRSGYFSSVRVLPQRDRRFGRTVPVTVRLEGREDNIVGIGIGYATDVEFRTKLTWEKPLVNRYGHSLEFEIGLSKPRQNASVSYRIPRGKNPVTDSWGIQYGLQNEDVDDTESFLSTLNFERVRRTGTGWTESLFIRWERERSRIGDDPEIETDLVLPGFSYSRSRSRGRPFPTWGQATTLSFFVGSDELLSTIDIYKTLFTFRYLQSFTESDRHAAVFAAQYGVIRSNDYARVPVSQRFFAGGDRSIRGFGFREASPRNDEDELVGGRYLEVLNLEYNYRFLERWAAAAFIDTGRAFDDIDAAYRTGAGVGFRWQSPVGPLRVDVATPISDGDGDNVRLHLSLGPDI